MAALIGLVFVIWPVYEYNVSNYPKERQINDTRNLLATTRVPESVIKLNLLLDSNSMTRPLGQYFLGLLTATNRTTTGNTTYFMGQISADSWKSYFPDRLFYKKSPAVPYFDHNSAFIRALADKTIAMGKSVRKD